MPSLVASVMADERAAEHAWHFRDDIDVVGDLAEGPGLDADDQFALRACDRHLASRHLSDLPGNFGHSIGHYLNNEAGNMGFVRRARRLVLSHGTVFPSG